VSQPQYSKAEKTDINLDETLVLQKPAFAPAPLSSEIADSGGIPPDPPKIGVIKGGSRPKFASETETLLRTRLWAAAIELMFVLSLGLIANTIYGNAQWLFLRLLIFGAVVGCYAILSAKPDLRMTALRWIEAILFGSVALQISLMMHARIVEFAKAGDAVSMISAANFFVATFCLHILTYGIFMPNTWKRAAVIMSLFAVVPYLIWFGLIWSNSEVAKLAALNQAGWPIPLPFIAAVVGAWGSHIINRTRREAFQARQILQYRLHGQIGSGGMGDVFRAEHILLKRPCAIKLIKPDRAGDERTLKLFEKEVIATARLSHWNSIDIYDYGHTDDGTFFYVMELLEGESLQTLVDRTGPMHPGRAVWILAQVCDALHEAHTAELVHRDIKPANIFVTCRGGLWDVAKLLDFGLVKANHSEAGDTPSTKGFSGTPAYMAPEQSMAYDFVDARTDIYAIGGVAYFMLTGQPPFTGKNVNELLYANAMLEVVPPSKHGFQIPEELDNVVVRCLAKDPFDRFQSATELATALRACDCAKLWNHEMAARWWALATRKP
jgi:serine/threonine-protein kinase